MILELTQEEKEQLSAIEKAYQPKIKKLIDAVYDCEPWSEEMHKKAKEYNDYYNKFVKAYRKKRAEFDKVRFDQFGDDPAAILANGKEQVALIIDSMYKEALNSVLIMDEDGNLIPDPNPEGKGKLSKDAVIEAVKSELRLHFQKLENPEKAELRDYIINYINSCPFISQGNSDEEEDDEESEQTADNMFLDSYSKIVSNRTTNEFASVSKKDFEVNKYTGKAVYKAKNGEAYSINNINELIGGLSTSSKKIFYKSLEYLTRDNYGKSATKTVVYIPLEEYAKANGKDISTEDDMKEFSKKVRRDLHDVKVINFTFNQISGKGAGIHGGEMPIISNYRIININGTEMIRVRFDPDAAQSLLKSGIMQFPNVLYKHDNRNSNGFAIGYFIAFHNSYLQNISAGTADTLRVKSLLSDAHDIPTMESLKEKGRRDWKKQIKEKLEKALDSNIKIGYLKRWEYRDSRTGETYTPEQASDLSWEDYNNLCVDYIVAQENPALEEYVQKKTEEKKTAKSAAAKTPGQKKRTSKNPPKGKDCKQ